MARYVVGDVQGCHDELRELLATIRFSADRDELWFAGDLVNRGPKSLQVLRLVKSLGDNARVILGNHDMHLLALWRVRSRRPRKNDTLDDVLDARDRDELLEWLMGRPLLVRDEARNMAMVHAGVLPQWSIERAEALASEAQQALLDDPPAVLAGMYGNEPDRWAEELEGIERVRVIINVLLRMRFCTADGRIDLTVKGSPGSTAFPLQPWFAHAQRRSRDTHVIFGHWSALGYYDADNVLCLDTGCVWGSTLTAWDLDERRRHSVPCRVHQKPGQD